MKPSLIFTNTTKNRKIKTMNRRTYKAKKRPMLLIDVWDIRSGEKIYERVPTSKMLELESFTQKDIPNVGNCVRGKRPSVKGYLCKGVGWFNYGNLAVAH